MYYIMLASSPTKRARVDTGTPFFCRASEATEEVIHAPAFATAAVRLALAVKGRHVSASVQADAAQLEVTGLDDVHAHEPAPNTLYRFQLRVVGLQHHDQELALSLRNDDAVTLVRVPHNEHDENACPLLQPWASRYSPDLLLTRASGL